MEKPVQESVEESVEIRSELLPPHAVQRALPPSREASTTVLAARESLQAVVHARDRRRLAVIVGPSSLHDPEGAFDYARRLRRLAETISSELVVVMRTSVERLVRDPHRDGSRDLHLGLATARQVLLRINELGLPCATERLDLFTAPYLRDLVAWGALGDDDVRMLRETSGGDIDEVTIAAMRRRAAPGVACPVMVDCADQVDACRRVLDALHAGAPGLLGLTLASYLEEGRQEPLRGRRLRYGVSIAGPCLGWNDTADLLCEIAEAVKLSH